MMRQTGKQILRIARRARLATAFAFVVLVFCPAWAVGGVLDETIVTDPLTGVALFGYDPVSYFTNDTPQEGRPDFEYVWQGVTWYFASAANRDVFIGHPQIYAPRFGGHGAMSLARGFLSDGNPHVYIVFRNQLFLFYSAGNRDAFIMSGNAIISKADQGWRHFTSQIAAR